MLPTRESGFKIYESDFKIYESGFKIYESGFKIYKNGFKTRSISTSTAAIVNTIRKILFPNRYSFTAVNTELTCTFTASPHPEESRFSAQLVRASAPAVTCTPFRCSASDLH